MILLYYMDWVSDIIQSGGSRCSLVVERFICSEYCNFIRGIGFKEQYGIEGYEDFHVVDK